MRTPAMKSMLACLLVLALPSLSEAQSPNSNRRIYRVVLEDYGVDKVKGYQLIAKPVCTRVPRVPACNFALSSSTQHELKERLQGPRPDPDANLSFSPVRDSADRKIVYMYVQSSAPEPGYLMVTEFEFVLNKQGNRVLVQRALVSDFVKKKE